MSAFIPVIDNSYVITSKYQVSLDIWIKGRICKNLFINGPTGSGKSSLVEQFAARNQIEVFRFGCHGKTEFDELLGSKSLVVENGVTSTSHDDGPLVLAAKRGSILLLDEGNFLPPKVFGGLNGILDGTPFFVPSSMELIEPHPDFRIAMTGNSVDGNEKHLYGGTNALNIAARDRFIAMSVGYLSPIDEARVLKNQKTRVSMDIISLLINFAVKVRNVRVESGISFSCSTRFLIKTVKILDNFETVDKDTLIEAMMLAGLDILPEFEKETLVSFIDISMP